MNKRSSIVEGTVITSVENSHVRIGDTNEIYALANVFAIQQLEPHFDGKEENQVINSFPEKEILFPQFPNEVAKRTFNECPFIKTGPIRTIGVAASSVFHIGSLCHMFGQSHVIHVRQIK